MARNTLSAVFGALGAGLTGYGRDREARQEAEERRRREALQESLTAANLLASGRFGTEAQVQASRGGALQTAQDLMRVGMTAGRGGAAPSRVPMPSDVAAMQTATRPAASPIEIGGQRLSLLRTAADEAREERAGRMEESALERQQRMAEFREQERLRGEREKDVLAARGEEDRRTAGARTRTTGLSPEDRAFQSVLQFSRTPIYDGFGQRLPTEEEVEAYSKQALTSARAIYSGQASNLKPSQTLTVSEWMDANPKRPDETQEEYRKRYQASSGVR